MLLDSTESTLAGSNIIVTGAAQGVGLGIVEELLNQGANVVMLDRDADALAASADKVGANCENTVLSFATDVTDIDGVRSSFESAREQLGSLDGLVNNAGIIHMGSAVDSTNDDWLSQMNVNVVGVVNCCNAFRESADGSGSIVNIASNAGKVGSGIRTWRATMRVRPPLLVSRVPWPRNGRPASMSTRFVRGVC
jgi:NAD(P)-dependent dehydrogenase (short-subunit alcohol dehydrogenase family)